jgi:hypothetical protein
MDDTSEIVIDKSDDAKISMIAAHVNLCALWSQSIYPRMDDPLVSEDRGHDPNSRPISRKMHS